MRRRLLAEKIRRRVIVTTKAGTAFAGVLFDEGRDALILREAVVLGLPHQPERLPVDGEVLILLDEVAYMQLP